MTNIDTNLAGTPKPKRGGWAMAFMLICIFVGPIGWGIIIGMWLHLNEEIKEWERHQMLAAILKEKEGK
jgi:hypothetical protein